MLADACAHVDVSTAGLDGFTSQLLGFATATDGVVRPIGPDGTPVDPAPDRAAPPSCSPAASAW